MKFGINMSENSKAKAKVQTQEELPEEEKERIEAERRTLEEEQKAYREMMKYNPSTAYKMGGSREESEQR